MKVKSTRAAILVETGKPLIVDKITLPNALGPGQVLVKVHYSSICGAQINEIDAVKGADRYLPHLLGHEASGSVVECGPGVTSVADHDTVVLHWRPSQGIQCAPPSYTWRGKKLNAGWVTTFNEYAVVSENRLTVIPDNFDLKVTPLLGCAVTTALGAINNDAHVKIGESVVVLGVGGVGLNIVQFAAMVAAHPIVAVDLHDRKLDLARQFGATHCIKADEVEDLDEELRRIVGESGPDKVLETTGVKELIELAYDVTHANGTCVLVGVPREKVTIHTLPIHFKKVLTGSHGGNSVPDIDIPRIIRLVEAGKLTFDGIITHEFALAEINAAFDMMRSGNCGRVLLKIGES